MTAGIKSGFKGVLPTSRKCGFSWKRSAVEKSIVWGQRQLLRQRLCHLTVPLGAFYHSLGITGTGNWTNFNSPELDVLIDAQAEEFDEEKRREIILETQRLILPVHGPQLTLTGGFFYNAHWNHVNLGTTPGKFGLEVGQESGPIGSDVWVTSG